MRAWADNTVIDGDGVTPIVVNALNFGNVCSNTTTNKTVLMGVSKQGSGTNVFKNGSSVTLSVLSTTGSGLSVGALSPSTVAIPSNWDSASNNTIAGASSSSVTFVAGTAGAFNGSITFRASGFNSSNSAINRDGSLQVIANVINCDNDPPTLSLPTTQVLEATGPTGAVATFSATASDANPLTPAVTCTPASGSTFAIATTSVSCSATDTAGNTATGSFNVTVQDTTPPNISGTPSNLIAEATGGSGAVVSYSSPTASDLVDGARTVTCSPASGSTFALGSSTIICAASDTRGNTATSQFTIKIEDTTRPVLSLPANILEEATGASGATVSYVASASDIVDGAIAPTCAPASSSTFAIQTTAVNCSATDNAGNTATGGFIVTVQDTTPPALSLPTLSPVEATGPTGAGVNFNATAADLVDGAVAVSCTPASGSVFGLGSTSVSCSATDSHGNTASSSFNVVVVDTTPPNLTLPGDQLLEATGPGGAVANFAATASDLVDANVTITCDAVSGASFPIATTTVKCTAIDDSGNMAEGQFTIQVQDTTAPVVTAPASIMAEATGPSGVTVNYSGATASDLVDGAIAPVCVPASGSVFAIATTTVICTATDAAGNSGSASFTIKVQDTFAPVVTAPANIVAEATGPSGATVNYSGATANDLVDGAIAPVCVPASGSVFAIATTTVTCTATDAAGNSGSASFTIKVQDTFAPSVSCGSADGIWHNSDVGIACTASDGGSGLANLGDASFNLTTNVPANTETANAATNSRSVLDVSGNSSTAGPVLGNKIDKKAPAIVVTSPTAAAYLLNQNVPASFGCTDLGSGVASCTGTSAQGAGINTASVGPKTFTVNAVDNVGNAATPVSVAYTVQYAAGGTCQGSVGHAILQPINVDGSSIFKLGSTVPAKFRVCDANGTSISTAGLITSFKLTGKSSEPANATINEDVLSTTPDTAFRWDASAQQWIFNISTKSGYATGTKYTYTISLNDGSSIVFSFGLK